MVPHAETEKRFIALNKLKEEDPTLKVEIDHDTHEAILGGQGQLHPRLGKISSEKDFRVKMEMKNPKISIAETITGKCRL